MTTLHNPDYTHEDNGRMSFQIRKLADRITGRRLTDGFLAVSDAVRRDYERHLGYRGVEAATLLAGTSVRLNRANSKSVIESKVSLRSPTSRRSGRLKNRKSISDF